MRMTRPWSRVSCAIRQRCLACSVLCAIWACRWFRLNFLKIPKENEMNKNLLKTIFKGVVLAMGVAVVVLNIVNPPSVTGVPFLLGIGVAALGIATPIP